MASVSGDFKEGGQWTATASSFSGNQTVSLSADVNPLSKVRTADLTISAAGISKSCTVSLTQEASEFEAKLTVVAIPAFAAGGGTYDSVVGTGHVVVKRNGVVIIDNDVRPVFLFKEGGSVSWITFSVTNTSFTVADRALESGGPRSVTIRAQYTLDVGGVDTLLECDVPISQAANFVETVSVSDASFAYSTIAAKGATVTPTTDSTIVVTMSSGSVLSSASAIAGYTYALTPSFSMTDGSGFTLNSTTTGSLTAASMGTTLGSRQSPTITYSLSLTYTPSSELSALGAKTVSGSDSSTGTATQGVNEITYSDLTIKTFSYFDTSTVLASGGTSVPRLFATETQTYTSGSVDSDVPVTGGSFALTTSGHGASVDSSTGVVTYASRGSVAGDAWSDSVTWTLTSHDLTATKSASVSQEANVETFVDHSNTYVADPSYDGRGNIVVVTGGTVTATPGVHLSYTSGSTVVKDVSASSTSEPVELGSGASWDASSWTLTIPSAGTSVYPENHSYGCTIEVTTPYGTTRFYMYRQANLQTLTGIRLAAPSVSGDSWISDWSAVPAAGGNLACAGYNQYSYTSGSTNEVRITDFSDVTVNTSVSWVEVLDDATYPMSLHVLSRGEIAGDARSSDVSWTCAGFTSNSLSFMQVANVKTFTGISARSTSSNPPAGIPDIDTRFWVAANGGVLTVSFIAKYSYSSGSSSEDVVSSGVSTEYAMTSPSATWDSANQTMTYISAGTDVSPVVYTSINFTYNELTGSTSFGRQANEATSITYGDITIADYHYGTVPASGTAVSPVLAYTQPRTQNYTSGATSALSAVTSDGTVSYSKVGTEGVGTIDATSGAVSAPTRGTVVGDALSIGTFKVSVTLNGKTATNTVAVTQQANAVTTPGAVEFTCSQKLDFPAGGVTINSDNYRDYFQFTALQKACTFTSGAQDSGHEILVNATGSMVVPSKGTEVSAAGAVTVSSSTLVFDITGVSHGAAKPDAKKITSGTQAANEATYAVPVLTLSYSDIAASGGSVTPSKSFTQSVSYTSGSTSTVTSGGSWSYSGTNVNTSTGAVSASALGYTVKARTKITDATATVSVNGKTGSASAAVYQQENYVLSIAIKGQNWITPVSPTLSFPAEGDTNSYTCYGTFTSGTVRVQNSALADWELSNSVFTKALNTALVLTVTAPSRGTTVGDARTSTLTVTLNNSDTDNKTLTDSVTLTQEANAIVSYDTPVVSLAYADIPAGGGSVTPSKSFTQSVSYTSGSTSTVTSGGSWSYSGTNVNTSTGAVSASALGYTVKARTKITDATATVSVNGKTGSASAAVYQQENYVLSIAIKGQNWITPVSPTLSFPAEGDTNSYTCYGTFTSGTVRVQNSALADWELSNSVFTKALNTALVLTVTAPSRGTTVGDARTSTLTVTLNNSDTDNKTLTDSVTLTQEANAIVSYDTPVVSLAYADIPAGGGSVTPTKSFTQTTTYTSGSTGSISSGGTWSYSGTGVDTSTGAVSGTSLGTTEVSRTKKTDATATITINGKSGSATVGVYQEANTIVTAGPVTITGAVVDDIPAGGGTISEFTAYGWTQDVTYTSGVTDTSNYYYAISFSDPVTAPSLGTTFKPRAKVGTLTLEVVGEKNESATLTLDVYQEANTATYSNPSITTFEYRGTPAVNTLSAGADNRNPTLLATQTGTWTSGETETASLISSKTFTGGDVNTSTGNYTVTSLGTVVTARQLEATITVNITMNGKTASDSLSLYREANEVTYSDPIVTHTSPISVAASAGQYQLKPNFTQRAYYTSGSETPILSGSFTYAVKTALTGFTLAPPTGIVSYTTNPSVSPRNGFVVTITGSGNGKSGTTDVTFNQEGAEPEIYVSLNGTRYGSSVTVNLEGKSASEVSVYVKTNDTFDVS